MELGVLMIYLIKATSYLSVFCLFNKLVLSRDTFHKTNRLIWLGIILSSFLLPFVSFNASQESISVIGSGSMVSGDVKVAVSAVPASMSMVEKIMKVTYYVYFIGFFVFLLKYIGTYITLLRFLRLDHNVRGRENDYNDIIKECEETSGVKDRVKYIIHNLNYAPFSWLNYIVIREQDLKESGKEILLHELAHVKQRHSLDMILVNIAVVLLWFNPIIWLIKRELQQTHEYLADESVLLCGTNMKEYQMLLIKKSFGEYAYSVSNNFFQNSLKKRIVMMLKVKSNKWSLTKCLLIVPIVALSLAFLATPAIASKFNYISNVAKRIESQHKAAADDVVFIVNGELSDLSMTDIDPHSIECISVFKNGNDEIQAKYGLETETSVIMVTLKNDVEVKYGDKYKDEPFSGEVKVVDVKSELRFVE